jgi:hypothetical protein
MRSNLGNTSTTRGTSEKTKPISGQEDGMTTTTTEAVIIMMETSTMGISMAPEEEIHISTTAITEDMIPTIIIWETTIMVIVTQTLLIEAMEIITMGIIIMGENTKEILTMIMTKCTERETIDTIIQG